MRQALRTAASRVQADRDLRLPEAHVLAGRKSHVASKHEFTAYAAYAATDFCDADNRGLRQSDERIHQDRKAGSTDRRCDVAELACQVEVAQVKVLHRALE